MSAEIYEFSVTRSASAPHALTIYVDEAKGLDLHSAAYRYCLSGNGIEHELSDGAGVAVCQGQGGAASLIIASANDFRLPPGSYAHSLDVTDRATGAVNRWFAGTWTIEAG